MPMDLSRFLLVGLGDFGANVLFQVKKRLAAVSEGNEKILLGKGCDELEHNPIQFLIINDTGSEAPDDIFRRYNFTGSDDGLFCFENEIYSFTDIDTKTVEKYFHDSISRLSNINKNKFCSLSGQQISEYNPAVIFVFDIALFPNQKNKSSSTLIKTIESIINPEAIELHNKYHYHAIIHTNRKGKNKEKVKKLITSFNNVFLLDGDSDFILSEPDDNIDIAANFLTVMAQVDNNHFKYYFDNQESERCFSIGATNLFYPKEELVEDIVIKLLGSPISRENTRKDDDFKTFFLGKFVQINAGEDISPFTLGKYEIRQEQNEIAQTEEIQPEIRPGIKNYAHSLSEESSKWLSDHIDRIKAKLSHDVLLDRINEITKLSTFLKIYFESWMNNLDALDFLLKYDVLQRATNNALITKNEFFQYWKNKIETIFSKIKLLTDENDIFINEHNGELAYNFSKNIIDTIRDVLLAQQEKIEPDTEFQATPPVKREEVEEAMLKVPNPFSLLLRFVVVFIIVFFYWDSVHNLLFSILSLDPIVVPAWISGSVFIVLFCVATYWFSYRKKAMQVLDLLRYYLQNRLKVYEDKIEDIERTLLKEFLVDSAIYVRRMFSTRRAFFYYTIDQCILDFKILVDKGCKQFITPPNPLESFYINRKIIYDQIQEKLQHLVEEKNRSILPIPVLERHSEKYEEIVGYFFNKGEIVFNEIYKSEKIKDLFGKLPVWNKILSINNIDADSSVLNDLIETIISEYGRIIEKNINNDPDYGGLDKYLKKTSYKMDNNLFTELTKRSMPTFTLHENQLNVTNLYTSSEEISTPEQQKLVVPVVDPNSFIFVSIDGPVTFKEIQWEESR